MERKVTFNVFKGGGHTFGTWKGDPISAKSKTEDLQQETNEEPMLPIILEDPKNPDKKKPSDEGENEDILMPPSL